MTRGVSQHRTKAALAAATLGCVAVGAGALRAADTVTINLTGTITASCALSGVAASASLGDITVAGSTTINFTTDCNAPFAYSLASLNGGLKHTTISTAPSGFAITQAYAVQTIIATNSGGGINQTCTSASIKTGAVTCAFTNSGTAVAIQKASSLGISWTASASPLLAGTYQDTLTLTVSVQP